MFIGEFHRWTDVWQERKPLRAPHRLCIDAHIHLLLLVQVTSLEPLKTKHEFSYENCSDNAVSVIYCSSYLRCLGMLFVLGCVGPSAVATAHAASAHGGHR